MTWKFSSLQRWLHSLTQRAGRSPRRRCKPSRPRRSYRPEIDCMLEERILLMTATSIALSTALTPTSYGQSVDETAIVTADDGGTATGTVTFLDGTTRIGTGTLAVVGGNVQATFSTTILAVGDHSLTAVYGGDTTYDGSTSSVWTQTVTAASLTITASDLTSSYGDGTTLNGATGFSATGLQNGEVVGSVTLATNATTSSSSNWNVSPSGSPWTITPSSATGGTFDPSNYSIAYVTGALTVNPAALGVINVNATSKVYDTSTAAVLDTSAAALSGVVSGDAVLLDSSSAAGTFAAATVGTGIAVSGSGFAITGSDATNYALSQPTGLSADITPLALTVTGVTANAKTYDGTTAATLDTSAAALVGVLGSDNVALGASSYTATFAAPDVGTGISVNVSGLGLTGPDAGNYTLTPPTGFSADITPAPLTVTADNQSAAYGGTVPTLTYTTSGLVSGDSLTGALTSDAGNAGATITGGVGSYNITQGTLDNPNYTISFTPATLTVTPAALTITASNVSMTYGDGTQLDGVNGFTPSGLQNGDTVGSVTLTTNASTSSSTNWNASPSGSPWTITPSNATGGTFNPSNYTISYVNGSLTVNQATLAVSITAADKTYDGTTTATLNTTSATLNGVVSGDSVSLNPAGYSAAFATANAGTGISVSVSGLGIMGADAGNYSLTQPSGLSADITPAPLTVTADNQSAAYGGTVPTLTYTTSGLISGDSLSGALTSDAGNAGATITGGVGSYNITQGTLDNPNYTISFTPATLTVTPAALTITASNVSMTYADGTQLDGVNGFTPSGLQNGDTVGSVTLTTNATTSSSTNWNASPSGSPWTITPSNATGGTFNPSNYAISYVNGTLSVSPASLTVVNASATNKVYDTTTADSLDTSSAALSGVVSGDNVSLDSSSAAGTFATSTVGTGIAVSASGFAITGSDAGNYSLAQPTGLSADITPASLTVSGVIANNKTYDGTTTATLDTSSATLVGVLGSDNVTLDASSYTAAFAVPDAGTGISVSVVGLGLTGPDAGNYTLTQPTDLSADITPASTSTLLTPSANALAPGQPVTLTVTVTPVYPGGGTPVGPVTFSDGPTPLGTVFLNGGTATLSLPSGLPAGSHMITAAFGGSTDFNPSQQNTPVVVGSPLNAVPLNFYNSGGPNQPGNVALVNPQAGGNVASNKSDDPISYPDGVVDVAATDLSSNGFGMPWGQTRSWTNGLGYATSGTNGVGWIDTQTPYLEPINGTSTIAEISNGMAAEYFDLVGGVYQPRSFDQSTLVWDSPNQQYILTDESGDQIRFADFSTSTPTAQQGQFVTYTDPAGNVTAVTAWTAAGQIAEVQRGDGSALIESWLYSYLPSTDPNAGLLASVTLRRSTDDGTNWSLVRQAVYSYYDGTQPFGNPGDLMASTIEDAAGAALQTYYYRYYTAADLAAGANGYVHGLEYAFTPASFARLSAAVGNPFTAADAAVAPYADLYLEYDPTTLRVTLEVAHGQGGTATGGLGTFAYSYTTSSNPAGTNSWAMRTVETLPDGNQNIVYTNAYGEVMLFAAQDATTGQSLATYYRYDDEGRVIVHASAAAVTGYDDQYADLVDYQGGSAQYLSTASGLITLYDYYTTTTATETAAGGVVGYQQDTQLEQGQNGAPILQETWTYFAHTAGSVAVYPVARDTVYRNSDGTGAQTTSYAYAWYAGTAAVQMETVTGPPVDSATPGSGLPSVVTTTYDRYGNPVWTQDADGYLSYTVYDVATGALLKSIADVNTADTSEFTGLPAGWSTPAGGGSNRITTYQVDALGRVTEETDADGNLTYVVYNDPAHEERVYTGWVPATGTATGGTTVYRDDWANGYSETLTMTVAPHLTNGVPDGTEPISNLLTLDRSTVNAAGQVEAIDQYFALYGLPYSTGPMGTAGVNFAPNSYTYDAAGRLATATDGDGNTTTYTYDAASNVLTQTLTDAQGNRVSQQSWTYDANGNVLTYTDGDGNVTSYTVDLAGKVLSQTLTDAQGHTVRTQSWTYDNTGNVLTATDGNGSVTSYSYDGAGNLLSQTLRDASGNLVSTQSWTYDAKGNVLTATDSDGNVTSYSYDGTGNVLSQTLRDASANLVSSQSWTYDANGNVLTATDGNGNVTSYSHDGAGNVLSQTLRDASGTLVSSQSWTYDANGNVLTATDGDGNIISYTYDGVGNVLTQSLRDASGNLVSTRSWTYDATGNVLTATDGDGNIISYTYDGAGNVLSQALRDASGNLVSRQSWTYDANSNVLTATDGDGNVTSYAYDGAGNVLSQTLRDARGNLVSSQSWTYDANGNVLTATDGDGNVTSYGYDGAGNVLSQSLRDASGTLVSTQSWTYDANGNVVTATDGDGNVTSYSYDGAGNLLSQTLRDASGNLVSAQSWTYDANGNVLTATDGAGNVTSYSYDGAGNALRQTLRDSSGTLVSSQSWTYDANGNVLTATDGDGNVTSYSYDGAGNVLSQTLRDAGGNLVSGQSWTYDANGNVLTATDGDGNVTRYAYDGSGNVLSQTLRDARGNLVSSQSWTYDANGNVLTATDGDGNVTSFTYDGAGNVLSQTLRDTSGNLVSTQSWTYDPNGNVLTAADGDGNVTTYAYDGAGNVLTQSLRDAGGNLVSSQSWTYDGNGNVLTATDGDGNVTSYSYDGAGNVLTQSLRDASGSAVSSQSWTYDANGNVLTATDGDGNVTSYGYDGAGNVLSQALRDAGGNLVSGQSWTYDANGNVLTATDGDGNVTSYTYDGAGNVLSQTLRDVSGSLVSTRSWTYDANGNVLTATDGDGNITSYGYDAAGNVVAQALQDAAGTVVSSQSWTYDGNGNVLAATDGDGNVTSYTYDGAGNPLSQTLRDAAGNLVSSASWTYDANGNVLTATDGNGNITSYTYDGAGNVRTRSLHDLTGNLVSTQSWTYDPNGNVLTATDGDGNVTSCAYDGAGNVLSQTLHDASGTLVSTQSWTYDANGNVLTTTDGTGNVTVNTYAADRLISTTLGSGTAAAATTTFAYDGNGNLAVLTDPDGNTTTFTYNALGQQTSMTDPLAQTSTMTYDRAGNLVTVVDRDGRTSQMTYHANRLMSTTWTDAAGAVTDVLSYTYDANGNLLTATNSAGTVSMSYAGNRLITRTDPTGLTLAYGYDGNGNVTSIQDSLGGQQTFGYNALNLVVRQEYTDGTTAARLDFSYDANGNLLTSSRYTDLAGTQLLAGTTYAYNGAGQVTDIQQQNAGGLLLAEYTYTYDLAGRLTAKTENGTTTTYSYDATGQLTGVNASTTYSYDANGNRTNGSNVVGRDNQLLSDGTWSYTYDNEGNLIQKTALDGSGTTWTYGYDNVNHLISAVETDSTGTVLASEAITYDALGNRIAVATYTAASGSMTVQQFAIDGADVYADLDGSGNVTAIYLFGSAPDEILARVSSGSVSWYLTDNEGSVRIIVQAPPANTPWTGIIVGMASYDAFGKVVDQDGAALTDRYGYTGREYDALTGLQYNRARYYDPSTGRWISQDPLGFASGDSNLYRYVRNGPTDAGDPSGLAPQWFENLVTMGAVVNTAVTQGIRQDIQTARTLVSAVTRATDPVPEPSRTDLVGRATNYVAQQLSPLKTVDTALSLADGVAATQQQTGITAQQVLTGQPVQAVTGAGAYAAGVVQNTMTAPAAARDRLIMDAVGWYYGATDKQMALVEQLAPSGAMAADRQLQNLGNGADPASFERGQASGPAVELAAQAAAIVVTEGAARLTSELRAAPALTRGGGVGLLDAEGGGGNVAGGVAANKIAPPGPNNVPAAKVPKPPAPAEAPAPGKKGPGDPPPANKQQPPAAQEPPPGGKNAGPHGGEGPPPGAENGGKPPAAGGGDDWGGPGNGGGATWGDEGAGPKQPKRPAAGDTPDGGGAGTKTKPGAGADEPNSGLASGSKSEPTGRGGSSDGTDTGSSGAGGDFGSGPSQRNPNETGGNSGVASGTSSSTPIPSGAQKPPQPGNTVCPKPVGPNSRLPKIEGRRDLPRTMPHQVAQETIAEMFRESGKYKRVAMGEPLSKFSGQKHVPDIKPDVMGLRHDGKIDMAEVVSPTQTKAQLQAKLENAMNQLPPEQRGNIFIHDPSEKKP